MTLMDSKYLDAENQGDIPVIDYSTNNRDQGDLSFLDVIPNAVASRSNVLRGLSIIVVGGGPAGLIFARSASSQGATVTVLERAGDPRSKDPGYTDRSFNVTIDNVGRYLLGDDLAWQGGIRLLGRAIHNLHGQNQLQYAKYGSSYDAELISIPRPVLRKNMVNMAIAEGTSIVFNAKVTSLDPDAGSVQYIDPSGDETTQTADLIVVSDGLHSLGDEHLTAATGETKLLIPESRCYMTAMLYPEDNHELTLNYMHFWHDRIAQSTVLGIPNLDGSIALLLITELDTNEVDPSTPSESLIKDFPLLAPYHPRLEQNVTRRRKYRLQYKKVTKFRIGKRGIVVGDAGSAMPFWAGYGANSAMYSAAALVNKLTSHNGDIDSALAAHEVQQKTLARLMMDFVKDQGDFLNGPVTDAPSDRSDPALAPLIRQAQIEIKPLITKVHQRAASAG